MSKIFHRTIHRIVGFFSARKRMLGSILTFLEGVEKDCEPLRGAEICTHRSIRPHNPLLSDLRLLIHQKPVSRATEDSACVCAHQRSRTWYRESVAFTLARAGKAPSSDRHVGRREVGDWLLRKARLCGCFPSGTRTSSYEHIGRSLSARLKHPSCSPARNGATPENYLGP